MTASGLNLWIPSPFQWEAQRYVLGSCWWNHWGRSWLIFKYIIITIGKSILIISLGKWKLWVVWQVPPSYWQQPNYYYHCYYSTELYLQTLNAKYFYLVSCQIPGVPSSVLVHDAYKHQLEMFLWAIMWYKAAKDDRTWEDWAMATRSALLLGLIWGRHYEVLHIQNLSLFREHIKVNSLIPFQRLGYWGFERPCDLTKVTSRWCNHDSDVYLPHLKPTTLSHSVFHAQLTDLLW